MVICMLVMVVFSLVLVGCVSVGLNYKVLVQELVVLQGVQQLVFSIVLLVVSWWVQFDDLVLEQLVYGVLLDNLDFCVVVVCVSQVCVVFVESCFDQVLYVIVGGSYDCCK